MPAIDPATLLHTYWHDSGDALVTDLRALLVDGANSVLEAGDLIPPVLASLEGKRAPSGGTGWDKALCLSVQDAGEEPNERGTWTAFVIVRLVDRKCGFRNIRKVRQALAKTMKGAIGNFYRGSDGRVYGGVMNVTYLGRTGDRFDQSLDIQYEALSFEVVYAQDAFNF